MSKYFPIRLVLVLLACNSALYAQSLTELEAKTQTAKGLKDRSAQEKVAEDVNAGVFMLLNKDQLKTGAELYRAGALLTDYFLSYRFARVKYETALAAAAMGDESAAKDLARLWDSLQISLGRQQRFGSLNFPGLIDSGEKFRVDTTPKCITEVMTDPAKAREAAATAKNNDELKTIVDADQAARKVKMTPDNLKKMGQEDKARSARVHEIIAKGDLHTAQDFAAASLVLQHGDVYASYALAHELSLCAFLLGDKNSAWLLAATYDRMLGAAGHDQRFGTQYRGISTVKLIEVDTFGINDTERTAMHCPTLAKALTREF